MSPQTSEHKKQRERKGREGNETRRDRGSIFLSIFHCGLCENVSYCSESVCLSVGSRNTAKDKNIPPVGASRHLFSTGRCLFLRRRYRTTTCCHFPFCRTAHFGGREMVQGGGTAQTEEKRETYKRCTISRISIKSDSSWDTTSRARLSINLSCLGDFIHLVGEWVRWAKTRLGTARHAASLIRTRNRTHPREPAPVESWEFFYDPEFNFQHLLSALLRTITTI